ncbi:MAG: [Victivallales bacterium]|nr:[FeFe] hydrogenase H-cluster maturation GTPase HydF [Victivallales bacterium]MBR4371424.1 [FeFe] hydrogenase H-cluster maturation GTPase HydF [Victivallales bacterium]
MNSTASSERLHIGFFGRSNVGKSSLMNTVTGQDMAVVSDTRGTTTDPVLKSMELLPLGPVVMFDTPGLDDDTELGALRMRKARQMLNKTDLAVMVIDATAGVTTADNEILKLIKAKEIPCVVAINKADLATPSISVEGLPTIAVSAVTGQGIYDLKELMAKTAPKDDNSNRVIGDLIDAGDVVVLVTPIDAAAPKGRLILPQVQTLRDILDSNAIGVVTKETELALTLSKLSAPPKLVVTDSQVFGKVAQIVPQDVPLTSFSILFSRYKGYLTGAVRGVKALDNLRDGDVVLISEGCTHHRQCGDIGTEKLPKLIRKHCGKDVQFEFTSGTGFPDDLSRYAVVVHCGGCMLTEREMHYRAKCADDQNIPFTNYGIAIAHMTGILQRSIAPLNL